MKKRSNLAKYLLFAIFLAAAAVAITLFWGGSEDGAEAPVDSLTGLEKRIDEVEITKLTVDPNDQTVVVDEADRDEDYRVATPSLGESQGIDRILKMAREKGVEIAAEPLAAAGPSTFTRLLGILPTILIGIVIVFVLLQYGSMGLGRKKLEPAKSNTSFEDIAGVGEAVEELRDIRAFLADPARFERLGAQVPKGVLLYGPPGTGKTLLAKAVATEAGVPFFAASGSEFVEVFAGGGARRARDLFEKAKKSAPSIIFIDELDAVGGHRSKGGGDGGTREADQTLIQLLKEMDGFEIAEDPVIVIGATNRLEALDAALTRPGRFDRHISIDPPDRHGRLEILNVHAEGKPMSPDVDLERLAIQTAGMSGAELALILNEAALLAARNGLDAINPESIDDAYFRVVAGAKRQHRTLTADERRKVAYHEAGHALVREHLKGTEKVHKISIIPRGRSGGQTLLVSDEDVFLYSEGALRDRLAGLLAGRAAEQLMFEEVSSGAADDLDKATTISEQMVSRLGMGEALGLLVERDVRELSPELRHGLEKEVREMLDYEYKRALGILGGQLELLATVAETLLDEETLDRDRFLELIGADENAPAPERAL